jgi:hypothetical protein
MSEERVDWIATIMATGIVVVVAHYSIPWAIGASFFFIMNNMARRDK